MKKSDRLEIPKIQDIRRTAVSSRVTKRNHASAGNSAGQPDPTQDLSIQGMRFGMNRQEAMFFFQKAEIKSLRRDLEATQDSLKIGMKSTSVRFKVSLLMTVLGHR